MRRGFGILQALLVIVLISGIMMIAMKYATVSVKQTKDCTQKRVQSFLWIVPSSCHFWLYKVMKEVVGVYMK